MISITAEILELSNKTLPLSKKRHLNLELIGVKGMDAIKAVLESNNIFLGKKIGQNKYILIHNGHVLENVYLAGNYEGAQVKSV